MISKPRSGVENIIGIWKGCLPYLQSIRMKVKDENSMRMRICYMRATIVLHNLLVNCPINEEWLLVKEPDDDVDDIINVRYQLSLEDTD